MFRSFRNCLSCLTPSVLQNNVSKPFVYPKTSHRLSWFSLIFPRFPWGFHVFSSYFFLIFLRFHLFFNFLLFLHFLYLFPKTLVASFHVPHSDFQNPTFNETQENAENNNITLQAGFQLAKLNWWQTAIFVIMLMALVCTVLYFILTSFCSKLECCKPKNPTQPKALRRKQRVRNHAVDLKHDRPMRKARLPAVK